MARGKPLANAPCHRQKIFPHPSAAWMTSAPLATPGANVEKSSERAPQSSQAHSYQWLGTFGNRGNGLYRAELRQSLWPPSAGISRRITPARTRPAAPRWAIWQRGRAGRSGRLRVCDRGKDYSLLDHPLVQARLHLPPDQLQQRPGKPDGSQPLRLPRDPGGTRGGALPRDRSDASRREKEESDWGHTRRRGLRTLLHAPPPTGVHRPPMSLSCICIAEPLNQCSQMKIRNRIPIAGAATRPGARSAGRSSLNGCGTCDWNWGISWIRRPCVSPSLLRLSRLPRRTRLPQQAMLLRQVALPWKAGRFSGQDFALQPDGTLRCPAGQKLVVA